MGQVRRCYIVLNDLEDVTENSESQKTAYMLLYTMNEVNMATATKNGTRQIGPYIRWTP
jgi:hypothetical protein